MGTKSLADDADTLAALGSRAVFDAIAHPTWVSDPDHRVLAANAALCQRLGERERSLVGKTCREIFEGAGGKQRTSPCVLEEAPPSGHAGEASQDVHLRDLGGHFRMTCRTVSRGAGERSFVLHMATDISEHKRAEAAAVESERLFRTLFDQAGDYILLVDPTDPAGPTIIDANQSACDKHGYSRDELLGMRMIELDAPEMRPLVPGWAKKLMEGESLVFETVHLRKDGSTFPVEVSAKLIPIAGEPRIFAIERDITERKEAEQEREKLHDQLLQTQKLESLGVLAGGVAHDFNNLLAAMLGNAELLLRGLEKESALHDYAAGIALSAQRAAEIVRQMLAYAGSPQCVAEPIDLPQVTHEMGSLLEAGMPKSVSLDFSSAPNPPAIEGDPSRVGQVVMNLITNAADALGEKGGTIRVRCGERHCDSDFLRATYLDEDLKPGPYAFVEVSDDGPGMDRATLDRIFDPFFTTKTEGRGLGLAAVLGIVRAHRGAIRIESSPGSGTTIAALFPALSGSTPPQRAASPEPTPWGAGHTILLVDDEPAVLAVAQSMLGELGFDVVATASGEAAMEACRADPDRFSAVVLDASMPGMGGPACLAELLRMRPDLAVLLVSGHDKNTVQHRFGQERRVLCKPYRLAELSEHLHALLDQLDP
ncbi:MAG: PAS domain S-box protein [Deltaproteobacteria bacterium]|jgi:PAS domain S-box-containing protein|nr:PAS domain S-box protein [Deltaproteobacteria bacterium]MBW2533921.1 PAS domain S-box protein [Deltaproteobacteria bacterium]